MTTGAPPHQPTTSVSPLADPGLLTRFEQHGFVGPYRILDDAVLADARATANRLIADVRPDQMPTTFALHNRHLDREPLWAVATNAVLLDVVERLFGPDLVLIGTRLVCKLGGQPSTIPWHQDIPFMGLDPARTVTAWVAVDDADEENGALALVPGSAHRPPRPHHRVSGDRRSGLLTEVEALDVDTRELASAVRPAVRAGEVLFFGGGVLHGGNSNASARRRCAMTVRFATGDTRPLDPAQWPAVCVRGDDGGSFGGRDRDGAAAYEASRRG